MAVKVVTDSTCDLEQELARRWDIAVVPCYVNFEDDVYKDGVDMGPDDFYRRLISSPRLPTTAQPSVHDFLQVYQELAGQGHDVVSIHVSSKLSGTVNSASQARQALHSTQPLGGDKSGRIEVIDSGMASMGLGLVTLLAARMIEDGASVDQVVDGVQDFLPKTHCYFLLDTLEYLHKGGRIGKASAFLGSLLSIKPILMVRDGEVHPVERVRTREKGVFRLVEIIRSLAPAQILTVLHSTTSDEAEALKNRLSNLLPEEEIIMSRFGPAVGRYVGPGALGVGIISSR